MKLEDITLDALVYDVETALAALRDDPADVDARKLFCRRIRSAKARYQERALTEQFNVEDAANTLRAAGREALQLLGDYKDSNEYIAITRHLAEIG